MLFRSRPALSIMSGTTSKSPMDTPPVNRTISLVASAFAIFCSVDSSVSCAMP